jgi:maltose O-acetyltransferase
VENLGQMRIGDGFHLNSQPVQSHLVTGPEGRLDIGDDVFIEYGTGVAAHVHVKLGNRVRVGPYAMILDTDFHDLNDRAARPKGLPVVIGDDVELGAWVTVLCGSTIGSGTRILPGSVVRSEIPGGVVAGGVPARVLASASAVE